MVKLIALILFLSIPLSLLAGWVNNVIWTFHQTDLLSVAIGIVGMFAAPIGALHGLYLFF